MIALSVSTAPHDPRFLAGTFAANAVSACLGREPAAQETGANKPARLTARSEPPTRGGFWRRPRKPNRGEEQCPPI
jgi:hypothetical protein